MVVFPCVCVRVYPYVYMYVCLSVTTWSPQLQDRATFWAHQQNATAENARKNKPIVQ